MTSLDGNEMPRAGNSTAADFDRPLLLTPGADIAGYLTGKLGRAVLFGIAATSVIAVLLIFVFIIAKSGLFLTTTGGDHDLEERNLAATQAIATGEKLLKETGNVAQAQEAKAAFLAHVEALDNREAKAKAARDHLLAAARVHEETALALLGNEAQAHSRYTYFTSQAEKAYDAFANAPPGAKKGQLQDIVRRAGEETATASLLKSGDLAAAQKVTAASIEASAKEVYENRLERLAKSAALNGFKDPLDKLADRDAKAQAARDRLRASARQVHENIMATSGDAQAARTTRQEFTDQANTLYAAYEDAKGAAAATALNNLIDAAEAAVKKVTKTDPESHAYAQQAKEDFLAAIHPTLGTELSALARRAESTFTKTEWRPEAEEAHFGMLSLIYGTMAVTVGSLVVAVPLGITAAVVLSDIVPWKVRQIVKPIVELLAAIPSVAWGFFAIMVVAPWLQNKFGLPSGTNALNASLILAVMAIPTIISVAEDALTALGRDLREASYALGATRFETLFKVVIPAAHNGILAAVILGMMRAIGETMVVWMAAGNAGKVPAEWWNLSALFSNLAEPVRTMTASIAGEMGETPEGSIHRSTLFAVGMLLLLFTFALNMINEYLTARFRKEMGQGSKAQPKETALRRVVTAITGGAKFLLMTAGWGALFVAVGVIVREIIVLIASPGWGSTMSWTAHVALFCVGAGLRMAIRLLQWLAEDFATRLWTSISTGIQAMVDPVRMPLRRGVDHGFTGAAYASVLLVMCALLVILVPIFTKGSQAVVFEETWEHREYLWKEQGLDPQGMQAEAEAVAKARQPVYDGLYQYAWLAPDRLAADVRKIARDTETQVDDEMASLTGKVQNLQVRIDEAQSADDATLLAELKAERKNIQAKLNELSKTGSDIKKYANRLRRRLEASYATTDKKEALDKLNYVLEFDEKDILKGRPAERYFGMAERYKASLASADLTLRHKATQVDASITYQQAYLDVYDIITGKGGTGGLLGPEYPEKDMTPEIRFGATRWSMAKEVNHQLQMATVWVSRTAPDGTPLPSEKTRVARSKIFEGTTAAGLAETLSYVDTHMEELIRPEWTFYWGFFTDKGEPGHYLGGFGPDLLGTVLVTVIAIVVSLPLGVIAAAYLIEVAGDNVVVRTIRMCINTLAGVPSIVFGLFGLAFFVTWFLPAVSAGGIESKSSILAGGLTLALLVLPIIIRASEEAIRSVPNTYKEASLGLGAGRLRCFLTVQLPAALPGVLTGTILAMSRAAGETAPLLFTCAVATGGFAAGVTEASPVLSYTAYDIAVGDRISSMVPWNQYGVVALLIVLVLLLNFAAILIRSRVSKRLRGG
jgi:phosphate ABC transporter permease protein PstC/phosphate ABC transporter permease subunit PstA